MISMLLFSRAVVSDSLQPHGLQHAACPSQSLGVWSNSCPSSWWCHPTISSSVVSFSSCLQSFPASGSFPVSQLFASGGQSIGALDLASVLPMNVQDWFPLGWTGWISLQSKGLSSLPCLSSTPGSCSNSCPSSWWCHPIISYSVTPFSSCLQSFPASGFFPVSRLFISGGQSIGASASASVLPMNIQGWFSLGLTGLISLWSKGLSRVFSNTSVQKHQFFSTQPSLWSNSHIHMWLLEKI